jgi:hypothetical protein
LRNIFLSAVILLLLSSFSFATHNRGAEITYRHIQGYEYEIKITTYTKYCPACNPAPPDREYLDSVHFGDDITAQFQRMSFTDYNNSVRVNKYVANHTYPEPGRYRIYFSDPNRNQGIVNLPNSVNTPLCVEAYITVLDPDLYCVNNSAVFDTIPFLFAQAGKDFHYNPTVTDPDHDSLSYELITPLVSPGVPVTGYTLPMSIDNFWLSSATGQLTWDAPLSEGEYNLAIKISEWRNDTVIGYVMRDFQVIVEEDTVTPITLNAFYSFALPIDTSGNYVVYANPGDTLNVQAVYHQSAVYNPPVTTYGEAFQMPNPPTVQYSAGGGTATANFRWIPDSSKMRFHPYVFVFSGISSISKQDDISFLVYVNGPPVDTCPDFTVPPEWTPKPFQNRDITIYPNPMNEALFVVLNRSLAVKDNRIKIFNSLGQIVRTIEDVTPVAFTIYKNNLPRGFYFLTLENNDEILLCKKIIIY